MKSFNNFNEAVKGQDTASRREGAKERAADKKSGKILKNTLDSKDYANVVARYGSEDNMKKGRGLGT